MVVNFIAIKVRLMEIWDAEQRGQKGGKAVGGCMAFVNLYICIIMKVGRRFVSIYRTLNEGRYTENQIITKFLHF